MATKYAIKRTTINTSTAVYSYEAGGIFPSNALIMKPLASAIDDDVYYSLIRVSDGMFLVEYEVDKLQRGFLIRKVYPNFVPSSIGLNEVNTIGGKVFMQINRKHLVTYLTETKTVIVLNLLTGEIEQNIDLTSIANNIEIDFVGYDEEGKWLIYRKSEMIYRFNITNKTETAIKNLSATQSLQGTNYAYVPKTSFVLYDSARRLILATVNYSSINASSGTSGFLRMYTGVKVFGFAVNGVISETSFNTLLNSEQSTIYSSALYNSSTGSYYNYNLVTTRGTALNVLDEKIGFYSSTTSFCIRRLNGGSHITTLPSNSYGYEPLAATVLFDYSEESYYKLRVLPSSTNITPVDKEFYGGTHILVLSSNKDKFIILENGSFGNTLLYNDYQLSETQSAIVTIRKNARSNTMTILDNFPIFKSRKSSVTASDIDASFSELEVFGRQAMYTRNNSDYLFSTYFAGIGASKTAIYNIVGVYATKLDSVYPSSGNNLDVYESKNINKFRIGNPLNGKLRSSGFDSRKALYHDYYETLNADLYLWYDSSNYINVSLYNRVDDTLKTIKTTLLNDLASYVYDVGIVRDGSKIVLIRHVMTTSKSTEYYVTNKDMSQFQTVYYSQASFPSAKVTESPQYWNRSCHVLVTELGVSGLTGLNSTTAGSLDGSNLFVYHRGQNNYNYVRASLYFDSARKSELLPSSCSVIQTVNPLAGQGRNSTIDAMYVENKYKLNQRPTLGNVAAYAANTSSPTNTIRSVPILSEGATNLVDITLSATQTNGVSNYNAMSTYYNAIDPSNMPYKKMSLRKYSVIVYGVTEAIFEDMVEGGSLSSYAAQQSDIRLSGITFLDKVNNYYLLKGTIYSQNPHSTDNQNLCDGLNFVFHRHATGTTTYFGIGMEADPFDVASNKVRYTNLGGTNSSDTGVQVYSYLAPPVQLTLDSKYPNKETFYVPDNVNYALKILDTDNTGGALTSLKMSINGTEIVNKTTGLKVNEAINFLVDLPNLYDTNKLNDGLNTVQFRLDAGGDITFLDIPLYKGKRYKLDAIPDIIPTTVITKAHIKAYNGQDELVPVSGVKTQSSSGEVEYVYHYSKDYAGSIRDLILQMDATKSAVDTVEIKKIIAVFEGGDN